MSPEAERDVVATIGELLLEDEHAALTRAYARNPATMCYVVLLLAQLHRNTDKSPWPSKAVPLQANLTVALQQATIVAEEFKKQYPFVRILCSDTYIDTNGDIKSGGLVRVNITVHGEKHAMECGALSMQWYYTGRLR